MARTGRHSGERLAIIRSRWNRSGV